MAQITIENYKRLAPTDGDHAIFLLNGKKFDYEVCSTHLRCTSGIPNDRIFDELHLDKVAFCKTAYRYSPVGNGVFPQYKTDDIGAAKRVISDLFYRIEQILPEQVITIDNYKSIPYIKRGDKVQFNVDGEIINYKVQDCYLEESSYYNSLIFSKLHLDKNSFCTNAYGYETNSGEFPNSKNYDLEALHRVINALFDHICTTHVSADVKPKAKSNLTEFNKESIKAPSLTTTFKITL